jgi:transcriptional regulator with XRE-family HTH domain
VDVKRVVGANVREARKARGMTQEEVASAAGLQPAYVGRVERGTQNPTIEVLARLAVALGVPVTRLLRSGPATSDLARKLRDIAEELDALDD